MPIGQEKGGTWWKVLLGVLGGFILGIGSVAGGVAIAGTVVKTGTLLGDKADEILSKDYQEKTVLQIVMDAIGGNIKVETLGDLNNITPIVGNYVSGIKDSLNDLGCELTNEEMYTWRLDTLSENIIGSVKGAKLIRVLSKDNIKYPDPIIKYLSYETYPEGDENEGEYIWATDDSGEYIYDEDGEHVLKDQYLTDMLDDTNYIQRKVDSMRIKMLFTKEDIEKSSLLTAIQDKSVKQLSKDGAFDDVELSAVIKITEDSPKILQSFAENHVTIGGMSEAIDDLYLDEVIDIDSKSSPVMKKLMGLSNSTEELPYGPKVTSFPFNVTRMEVTGTGKDAKVTTQYDYVVFSDGEGHYSGFIPFDDTSATTNDGLLGKELSTPGMLDGFNTITIDDSEKGYTLSGPVSRANDEPKKAIHTDKVDIANVIVPDSWGENLYALSCNKRTKVNELGTSVDGLKFREAMEIGINDPLWRIRDSKVNDGDVVSKLYVVDVFENKSELKFINKLDDNTPVTEIGQRVNDMALIDAFSENIFCDKDGEDNPILNSTWKYLLIEEGETWISGNPKQDPNPFAGYACADYTVGGDGQGTNPKGIDQLIANMTYNMANGKISQLHADRIITLDEVGVAVLSKTIPLSVKEANPPEVTAGCTYYGDLTFTNFVRIATGLLPTT